MRLLAIFSFSTFPDMHFFHVQEDEEASSHLAANRHLLSLSLPDSSNPMAQNAVYANTLLSSPAPTSQSSAKLSLGVRRVLQPRAVAATATSFGPVRILAGVSGQTLSIQVAYAHRPPHILACSKYSFFFFVCRVL